ncbi:MAG: AraC family transcriptional regulator [Edaphobacter sp.]|nr:AraC family transcriptional regulator [Edaphobacter sp.]
MFVKGPEKNLSDQSAEAMRIMAVRDGERKPLFDSALQGPHSPSPSLLIEKHDVRLTDWQTVILPDQVLTLYLRRCAVEYGSSVGDRQSLIRTKGSVVIEKRACEQSFRLDSPASTLTVRLSDSALTQAAEAAPNTGDSIPADSATKDAQLSSLLYALERERMHGYPAGRLFVDGIEQALAAILVSYDGIVRRAPQVYKGGLAPYRMKRVNEFIQTHMEEEITLGELAQAAGLSPSHFCSLFRKTLGTTPHQFVLGCRIQHARTLLANPRHSILDVALASGFRTHQHFSRIFHRLTGASPSGYRAQL